jgi:hypothetical protein
VDDSQNDLTVLRGENLIRDVALWNRATHAYEPARERAVRMSNLCSATLVRAQNIFFSGEEVPRAACFAHSLDGTSYELPRLGRAAWENAVMHPTASKTIVIGLNDRFGGHVFVYVGEKQTSGSVIERAGLTNGTLFVIEIAGFITENLRAGFRPAARFDCCLSATFRT